MSEYKALLRVDVDYGGSGIWEIPEPRYRYGGTSISYESLRLPAWLIERFDYWTSWYELDEPWRSSEKKDSELYRAYALSLAIDLKRVLGGDYYIECGGREIHDDRAYLREKRGYDVA